MASTELPFSAPLSLFLVLALLVIVEQTSPAYCERRSLPEKNDVAEPEGSLVGRPSGRRGRRSSSREQIASPLIFYHSCPKEPNTEPLSAFQRRMVFFHRPGDTLKTEMRMEEVIGPKQERKWNTEHIDMMISDYDFDLSKPTLMYTHGYLQDTRESYMKTIRENYQKLQANRTKASYNLMLFDWGAISYGGYSGCVAETPRSAKLLADFFEYLHTKHHYDLAKLHLISFSLSTHIVGQVGRILAKRQRVGQITYLDPTGVCFHDVKGKQFGDKYGARDTDAVLTVAKHYNMKGFGSLREHVGRVNIQVNNGKMQPPAPSARGLEGGVVSGVFPSHLYSVLHNTVLFKPDEDCHDVAYQCTNYEDFLKGQCGSCGKSNETCMLMNFVGNVELGIDPSKINYQPDTRMFITTGETQFCAYQYQVVLTLKQSPTPEVAKQFNSGDFSLEPSKGFVVKPKNQRGRQFTQLLIPKKRVASFPTFIDMSKHQKALSHIESLHIRYLSHYSRDARRKWSVKYCPTNDSKALTTCKH